MKKLNLARIYKKMTPQQKEKFVEFLKKKDPKNFELARQVGERLEASKLNGLKLGDLLSIGGGIAAGVASGNPAVGFAAYEILNGGNAQSVPQQSSGPSQQELAAIQAEADRIAAEKRTQKYIYIGLGVSALLATVLIVRL